MRLSADQNSQFFHPVLSFQVQVYFNEERRHDCMEADEESGWVIINDYSLKDFKDDNGRQIPAEYMAGPVKKKIKGKVELCAPLRLIPEIISSP